MPDEIEPAHVVALPKGQCFALLEGGTLWKVRMPLPAPDPDELMPKDLQELAGYMRQHYVEAGDWWEIELPGGDSGWVYAQLVTTDGDVQAVAVAANIPTPPPTATPAPTSEPAAAVVAASVAAQPTEAAPATTAAPAAAATTDPGQQPFFKLVAHRMWSKEENGACSGQHLLRINVIDANGVRINGVRLQGIYTGEVMVTGSQGKGDGVIEYDLYGTGEGFRVTQNDDGRPATSDAAEGFTTKSLDISVPTLIGGGYCTDEADCQIFYNSYGCTGHHSCCLLYTSPSPRDRTRSRMPSSA